MKMIESVKSLAHEMRMFGIHAEAARRCEQALEDSMHPADLIKLLLEDEKLQRKNATAKRLMTRAKFRTQCDIENWDQSHPRGLAPAKLKDLKMLEFFHKKQNLIITGPTGVGKTHLAIALGRILCSSAIGVSFHSINLFFEQVKAEKVSGKYLNFIERMRRVPVLVFDDIALRKYTHEEANTLIEILEERYSKGICIVTSQVDPEGWSDLFEDPVTREAIIDRFVNPSQRITLAGESYRKRRGAN